MRNNFMEQNSEQDIQQLLQIREEIHKEIEKISLNVLQLQEATNVEYFKVFETLSQSVQEQLKATLKNAAFEIAELTAEDLLKRVESQIKNILGNLDQSVQEAKTVLENVPRKNTIKTASIFMLLLLLSLSIGFCMGGYYYEKRSCLLSRAFLKSVK